MGGGLRYDEPASGPEVATDVDAFGENVQIVKPAFGDGGSPATAIRVSTSAPLPARDYHGGTTPFDSGLQPVAAGAPALVGPGTNAWLDALLLVNLTEEAQSFVLTDGDGNSYGGRDLDPKELRSVPLFGFFFSGGIKAGASVADAISIQLKGTR